MSKNEFYLAEMVMDYLKDNSNYSNVELLGVDSIQCNYEDYQWLLSKLDNDIDKSFFNESFIPITSSSPLLYLDFNTDKPSVFELSYYWREPYHWFKVPVVEDVLSCLIETGYVDVIAVKENELDYVSWFMGMDDEIKSL